MRHDVGAPIIDSSYVVATLATIWAIIVRPFSRRARDARFQAKYERAWFRGTPLVVGMSERVPSAPERMAALEAGQADIKVKLDELHGMVKTLMPNVKNTNNTGDLNYRIAEKLGVVLPEEPDGHA